MVSGFGIDTINVAYYTVADGDGQTPAAREASIDVGRGPRLPARCGASVLRLNQLLDQHDFDEYVEGLCQRFYANDGRPGLPPGRYFRLLLIGYFEGLDAERGIAWRADEGDTTTIQETLPEAAEQLEAVAVVTDDAVEVIEEIVADEGYHSRTTVHDLETLEIRTYISEPDRGPQPWTDQEAERDAVYTNRRRIRGDRGQHRAATGAEEPAFRLQTLASWLNAFFIFAIGSSSQCELSCET